MYHYSIFDSGKRTPQHGFTEADIAAHKQAYAARGGEIQRIPFGQSGMPDQLDVRNTLALRGSSQSRQDWKQDGMDAA